MKFPKFKFNKKINKHEEFLIKEYEKGNVIKVIKDYSKKNKK